MSAYDTVERTDDYWVRVYIEAPHDDPGDDCRRIMLSSGGGTTYLTPDKAEALGRALIKAATRGRQADPMDPR